MFVGEFYVWKYKHHQLVRKEKQTGGFFILVILKVHQISDLVTYVKPHYILTIHNSFTEKHQDAHANKISCVALDWVPIKFLNLKI